MKEAAIITLIGFSTFLLINNISKNDKKLDMVISNQEMIWLNTNELKIDSLNLEIMEIGAKLDSCKLINTK